jgi:hypothetical protein
MADEPKKSPPSRGPRISSKGLPALFFGGAFGCLTVAICLGLGPIRSEWPAWILVPCAVVCAVAGLVSSWLAIRR